MKHLFLEAGEIANTHGIRGELKIVPWCDTPGFLCAFDTFYIEGIPYKVRRATVNKTTVIASLEGVDDINAAMCLKGKIVHIDRTGIDLPNGRHFIADLIGLEVCDAESGAVIGTLVDVLTPPAHEVYVVKGQRSYLIPAVDEFLVETNLEDGYIRVKMIEGFETDVLH